MRKLPLKKHYRGYDYEQVKRSKNVAMYKQFECSLPTWEVWEIKSHNGRTIKGNYIEPSEMWAGDEMWGVNAWTTHSIERAEQLFNKLEKRINQRK